MFKRPEFVVAILFVVALVGLIKFGKLPHTPDYPATPAVYDTDPQNDAYIKGSLSQQELSRLDRILMVEKGQSGKRLSQSRVADLANQNTKIIDAYDRWRNCYDMMRSSTHVVYPDERKHLKTRK
jgi:hypothetical protein